MAQPVDVSGGNLSDLSNEDQARLLEEVRISRQIITQQQQPPLRTPNIPSFNGDGAKGIDYSYWKALVLSLQPNYSDVSLIQAIRKSAYGQPAQIIGTLPISCTLNDIFHALDTAYELVLDEPTAWQKFYNARQQVKEPIVDWHTRLTSMWSQIPNHGPALLNIKKRLWDGLSSDQMKESSRHQYDNDTVDEAAFVRYLRHLAESRASSSKVSHSSNMLQHSQEVDELKKQVASLITAVESLKSHDSSPDHSHNNYKGRPTRHQPPMGNQCKSQPYQQVPHQYSVHEVNQRSTPCHEPPYRQPTLYNDHPWQGYAPDRPQFTERMPQSPNWNNNQQHRRPTQQRFGRPKNY